jgi:hypothetical protein
MPSPDGPPTSSAASTPTSRCCYGAPSTTPAGCPDTRGPCQGAAGPPPAAPDTGQQSGQMPERGGKHRATRPLPPGSERAGVRLADARIARPAVVSGTGRPPCRIAHRTERDPPRGRQQLLVVRTGRVGLGYGRSLPGDCESGEVRGNAARLVSAPVLCLCNRRREEAGGVSPTHRGRARSARRSRASRTSWSRLGPARCRW